MILDRVLAALGRGRDESGPGKRTATTSSAGEAHTNQPPASVRPMSSGNNRISALNANSLNSLETVIEEMLNRLRAFLPAAAPSLPAPDVLLVSLKENPVGVGNRRGNETRGSFGVVELKGNRLESKVRFELWAGNPGQAETDAAILNAHILTNKDILYANGFLRLKLENAPAAEHISSLNAWRKHVDYHILFEYRYLDTDSAHSLIARIPVHTDPEVENSPYRETNIITDEMVRWDNENAPLLQLRGKSNLSAISVLIFVSGAYPTDGVNLLRTYQNARGTPTDYANLTDFLNAVNDPISPDRHAQLSYATLTDFINEFSEDGGTIDLGDWDLNGLPDSYSPKTLNFIDPIKLPDATDIFEIGLQSAAFSEIAVMYMKGCL